MRIWTLQASAYARVLAKRGVDGFLSTLHPSVRWSPPTLVINRPGPPNDLMARGRGLAIVPVVFAQCVDVFHSVFRPDDPIVVMVPALRCLADAQAIWVVPSACRPRVALAALLRRRAPRRPGCHQRQLHHHGAGQAARHLAGHRESSRDRAPLGRAGDDSAPGQRGLAYPHPARNPAAQRASRRPRPGSTWCGTSGPGQRYFVTVSRAALERLTGCLHNVTKAPAQIFLNKKEN